MLQNAYLLAKIGADIAENERNSAKNWQLPYGSDGAAGASLACGASLAWRFADGAPPRPLCAPLVARPCGAGFLPTSGQLYLFDECTPSLSVFSLFQRRYGFRQSEFEVHRKTSYAEYANMCSTDEPFVQDQQSMYPNPSVSIRRLLVKVDSQLRTLLEHAQVRFSP